MPINYNIQAEVVDIRSDDPLPTDSFLVDTNVWYWMTYTRASHAARSHQITYYPSYIKKAISARSKLHRCELSLAELAHTIESTELEIYARSSGLNRKEFRHNCPAERRRVVAEIQTAWGQVKTMAQAISILVDEPTADAALTRLNSQPVDGYDLFILEAISESGVVQVITDDGDFATVPGIIVFTANTNVLNAARQQGKIVRR
jgi:predicted nucleic acid-binding protein